jgi:hypothetical protein
MTNPLQFSKLSNAQAFQNFFASANILEQKIIECEKILEGGKTLVEEKGVLEKHTYNRFNPHLNDTFSALSTELVDLDCKKELLVANVTKTGSIGTKALAQSHCVRRMDELQNKYNNLKPEVFKSKMKGIGNQADYLMHKVSINRQNMRLHRLPDYMKKGEEFAKELTQLRVDMRQNKFVLVGDDKVKFQLLVTQFNETLTSMNELRAYSNEPIAQLIELLENVSPVKLENIALLEGSEFKEKFDSLVQKLHPELQNRLDYFVYLFSQDPNKGGDGWGKHHRHDHLGVLTQAFASALCDHIKHNMPESYGVKRRSFVDAFAKKFYLLSQQAKELGKIDPNTFNSFQDNQMGWLGYAKRYSDHQPGLLCKAFWVTAGHGDFQKIINGQAAPKESLDEQYAWNSILKEKSEIKKAHRKVDVACKQQGIKTTVKKGFLQGTLEELPLEQRYKIEERIYFLSKDPSKGGEFWGRDHAYDDPQVLLQAVNEVMVN